MASYEETYRRSLADPDGFWGEAAAGIHWEKPPEQALDDSNAPFVHWFPGARLNTCHNALDRHVEAGNGARPALIYDSPVTGTVRTYSYAEALDEVARLAGALSAVGVQKGDTVLIYMPMVPEAVWAMLASARLGAVHSVVFGGFAPRELAQRIDDARPKVILSASGGVEGKRVIPYGPLLQGALDHATHRPERRVTLRRPGIGDEDLRPDELDRAEFADGAEPVPAVPVEATDPLYILYTSGTTGKPKGVVRDNGGHAVALHWSMRNIYDAHPGDVWWTASDIGWVVGHSYIVYAPLLYGCTTLLYEGKPVGTPDAGAFWRVIADHRVRSLFTAPTAMRAVRKEDPEGDLLKGYDISSLEYLFMAGERLDPATYEWASEQLGVPVVDHWWQTETGWAIAGNLMGADPLPIRSGSPTKPVPGYDVRVLDVEGAPVEAGEEGVIAIRLPLPPGCLTTLWNDDDRFVSSYLDAYPGHYATGDGGRFDEDGYLWVMGRVDDVINVAGHRLSTGGMEEAISGHPDVAECAVVGAADAMKGQVPLGLVVLKAGVDRDAAELENELKAEVRGQVGAIATPRRVAVVPRLPKTRSGKVLRRTIRQIADGEEYVVPSTVEDPAALDEIRAVLDGPRT
ncbi:MAG: propionyl-CoA synthetase [Solirubrobacterales bacterium]|nr:propionyl-CoA synthetase [Solirubrobacterales bacterium]